MKRVVPYEKQEEVSLQIAPMVNLMLVLIAVFTFTLGETLVEAELGVQIPGGKAPENPVGPVMNHLEITREGVVKYNNSVMDESDSTELPALVAKLKRVAERFGGDEPVVIRPHPDTRHQRVMDVLSACASAGMTNVSFSGGA